MLRPTIRPGRAKNFGRTATARFARWQLWLVGFVFALAGITPALAGTWTQLGALNTPRDNASVALLPNGLVLVAGGANASGTLSSAELYNPATGTFTVTGSLTTARYDATATMLPNGTVLIAGGANGSSAALATAEIYNPANGTFSTTGSMAVARSDATATLLVDGKVLIAGGANISTAIADAELYDAVSGQFAPTGSLQTARSVATATLLPDGRVLIAGGQPSELGSLATTEIYDPTAETFGAGAPLTVPRVSASATLLPSGKVLIAGGYSDVAGTFQVLASAELYDPVVGTSTATGTLANARFGGIAALLPSGDVLIAGGSNSVFIGNSLASAENYNATSGTFSPAGSMANARDGASSILLPNAQVIVVGGANSNGFPAPAETYDASNGTFAATGSLSLPNNLPLSVLLPGGRVLVVNERLAQLYDPSTEIFTTAPVTDQDHTYGTLTLLGNGQVLAAGGLQVNGAASEQYDPVADTFTPVGSMNTSRISFTATLLADGRVLCAGGEHDDFSVSPPTSTPLASTEIYDPATQTFTVAGDMLTARIGATATLLPNGKVLIVGGYNSFGPNEPIPIAVAELYDVNTVPSATGSGAMNVPRFGGMTTHLPNGKVLIAGGDEGFGDQAVAELYDPATGTFSMTGSMTIPRGGATATLLQSGKVLIAGGDPEQVGTLFETLSSAELYDPATGLFSPTGTMTSERQDAAATLLPNGKVLVVGGSTHNVNTGTGTNLQSAELYDPGIGFADSRRAQIFGLTLTAQTQPLAVVFSGSGFRASTEQVSGSVMGSEASSGNTQSAATNYPLLQLRRVDNDQQFLISPDPTQPWTDTSFTTTTLSSLPLGFYRATLFVNAIPSQSSLISVAPAVTVTIVGGDMQTTPVGTQFTQPLQAKVTDTNNNPLEGVSISIACSPAANGACILAHGAQVSDANGLVSVTVTADDESGSYIVSATATATASGSGSASFHLSNSAGPAANMNTTGTPQSTQVNTAFASTLQITVTDLFNNPVPGVAVTFSDPASGASAGLSGSSINTDSNGHAAITATANTIVGSYVVSASVGTLNSPFNLTNAPGPAASLTALNGPVFAGTAGLALATSPAVVVTDSFGNPIAGVAVTFAPGDNSGSITEENPLTDNNGVATAGSWTLAADPGTNTLQASGAGLLGSPVQFSAVGSASVDVAVSMTNNRGFVQFGHTLDYVIVVTASGPSNAHNVLVTDLLPSAVDAANATWVCLPAVGASCTASGVGDLVNQSADIPTGGSVTFELSATVLNEPEVNNDTITNSVTVSVDGDTDPSNNTETVVTEAVIFRNAFEAGGDGSH